MITRPQIMGKEFVYVGARFVIVTLVYCLLKKCLTGIGQDHIWDKKNQSCSGHLKRG
jgi:hypothetical protein